MENNSINKPNGLLGLFDDKKANYLLIILLALDLVFVIIHYVNALTPLLNSEMFSIGIDNGYAEIFQYLKFSLIIFLFGCLIKRTGTSNYLAWILVFLYLLIDDSIRIHDRFGSYIAWKLTFEPPFGLRLMDVGELIVSVMAGSVLIAILSLAYKKGTILFRKISENIFTLLVIMAFFGVGMDMLHMIIIDKIPETYYRAVNSLLGLVEDGGEMVSVSFILFYCYYLNIRTGVPDLFVRDFLNCKKKTV
jgi:hypothetical protein